MSTTAPTAPSPSEAEKSVLRAEIMLRYDYVEMTHFWCENRRA